MPTPAETPLPACPHCSWLGATGAAGMRTAPEWVLARRTSAYQRQRCWLFRPGSSYCTHTGTTAEFFTDEERAVRAESWRAECAAALPVVVAARGYTPATATRFARFLGLAA